MFETCPKIDAKCGHAGYSRWDPTTRKNSDTNALFCGIASGRDIRVNKLPNCWKKMTKYEQNKYKKIF